VRVLRLRRGAAVDPVHGGGNRRTAARGQAHIRQCRARASGQMISAPRESCPVQKNAGQREIEGLHAAILSKPTWLDSSRNPYSKETTLFSAGAAIIRPIRKFLENLTCGAPHQLLLVARRRRKWRLKTATISSTLLAPLALAPRFDLLNGRTMIWKGKPKMKLCRYGRNGFENGRHRRARQCAIFRSSPHIDQDTISSKLTKSARSSGVVAPSGGTRVRRALYASPSRRHRLNYVDHAHESGSANTRPRGGSVHEATKCISARMMTSAARATPPSSITGRIASSPARRE